MSYDVPSLNASFDLDRVLVIIPVLNEEDAIAGVIQRLQLQGLNHIRVIDNGSTDGSAVVALKLGVEVIQEEKLGYGQACWRGLQHLPPQIDWILFCDGDGSDDLKQLSQFWIASGTADFILANRRADRVSRSKLTPAQNWGNGLATFLIHLGWGHRYQDLGPLRLIRRAALEKIQMQDRAFGWTVEMQVRAIEEHLEIIEIPAQYHDRQGGKSKISGTMQGIIKAGLGILSTIAKLYIQYLKRQFERKMT
jgi:glycosyltransferase involved in cell wall biosynthesis